MLSVSKFDTTMVYFQFGCSLVSILTIFEHDLRSHLLRPTNSTCISAVKTCVYAVKENKKIFGIHLRKVNDLWCLSVYQLTLDNSSSLSKKKKKTYRDVQVSEYSRVRPLRPASQPQLTRLSRDTITQLGTAMAYGQEQYFTLHTTYLVNKLNT